MQCKNFRKMIQKWKIWKLINSAYLLCPNIFFANVNAILKEPRGENYLLELNWTIHVKNGNLYCFFGGEVLNVSISHFSNRMGSKIFRSRSTSPLIYGLINLMFVRWLAKKIISGKKNFKEKQKFWGHSRCVSRAPSST